VNEYDEVIAKTQKQKKNDNQDWLLNMVTMVTLANAIACSIILVTVLSGCASKSEAGYSSGPEDITPAAEPVRGAEVKLGIRMEGLRLSAAGYILDFRYRVVDPEKGGAAAGTGRSGPYLLDEGERRAAGCARHGKNSASCAPRVATR